MLFICLSPAALAMVFTDVSLSPCRESLAVSCPPSFTFHQSVFFPCLSVTLLLSSPTFFPHMSHVKICDLSRCQLCILSTFQTLLVQTEPTLYRGCADTTVLYSNKAMQHPGRALPLVDVWPQFPSIPSSFFPNSSHLNSYYKIMTSACHEINNAAVTVILTENRNNHQVKSNQDRNWPASILQHRRTPFVTLRKLIDKTNSTHMSSYCLVLELLIKFHRAHRHIELTQLSWKCSNFPLVLKQCLYDEV